MKEMSCLPVLPVLPLPCIRPMKKRACSTREMIASQYKHRAVPIHNYSTNFDKFRGKKINFRQKCTKQTRRFLCAHACHAWPALCKLHLSIFWKYHKRYFLHHKKNEGSTLPPPTKTYSAGRFPAVLRTRHDRAVPRQRFCSASRA